MNDLDLIATYTLMYSNLKNREHEIEERVDELMDQGMDEDTAREIAEYDF